jgi:uncharacterized protein (DUF2252 family)
LQPTGSAEQRERRARPSGIGPASSGFMQPCAASAGYSLMTMTAHVSVEERWARGRALRERAPRSSHADWSPGTDRPDPVALLEAQNADRVTWLVPIRRGRMSASPFTFFRGAARIMAADLAATPTTGLDVQACGDAHLANFGLYASPERELVFDLNDFDETIDGPWEWDIKRLAASFTIAARHNGLKKSVGRRVAERVLRAYREAMAKFAEKRYTDVFYAMLSADDMLSATKDKHRRQRLRALDEKAKSKTSIQALHKLTEAVAGEYRIRHVPPVLIPLRHARPEHGGERLRQRLLRSFKAYEATVPHHCKRLLDRYRPIDIAFKMVGVGSVGTECFVLLLEGRDRSDPLFLQIKQAGRSVLEEYLSPGPYDHQGRRVVEGQRLMQAVSDPFLGWARETDSGRDFYWRQLRDWKGSVNIDDLAAPDLHFYARLCGWTLARAHARSGDPIAISGYLGSSDAFDKAVARFADVYADQNERDYAQFIEQIESGKLEAETG